MAERHDLFIVVLGLFAGDLVVPARVAARTPLEDPSPHHTHTGIRCGVRWFSFRFTELISASVST